MYSRVLIVLVLTFICLECAILSGKALFCRDPDSGKLHAVNTTWASVSFCGNYTCKLRKRNITKNEQIRQFNITNIKQDANKTVAFEVRNIPIAHDEKSIHIDNMIDLEKQLKYYENKVVNNARKDQYNDNNRKKATYAKMNSNNEAKPQTTPKNLFQEFRTLTTKNDINDDNDRYLSEDEIKAITDILRTVKKSDLYAIIDIYNLAHDIYKEMDNVMVEELKDETTATTPSTINEEDKKIKPISYWYDSLASKGKILDIEPLGSKETTVSAAINDNPPDFNEALSNKDFSKLPLYYPISDFQRFASYSHVPQNHAPKTVEPVREPKIPRDKEKHFVKHPKKEIQRSYLLPYPFAYINHYNVTDLPSFYYNNPSWRADYYNRYKYYQPYYNAFIAQLPNTLVYSDEVQDIEQRPMNKQELDKIKNKPDWKTAPIPREDIDDIRANIDMSKVISFPLRKLVKLDKVGKLSKMTISEESVRSKRAAYEYKYTFNIEDINGDDGDYETYLEKITCKPQTELGFFRIGNMSQPYPHCCPQLIKKNSPH